LESGAATEAARPQRLKMNPTPSVLREESVEARYLMLDDMDCCVG
jgi:hypothetical protein